ncbi:MAG TPA: TraR/DksA C4-type zinc finger protein [Balneolales bacterium]|nr:TraR/DksA C4-type zinc finger protein [Balneolales bacterium]
MEVSKNDKEKDEQENNQERVTPYSDEELEYFRQIILKKRDEAEQDLDMLQESLKESMENASDDSAYSFHMADAGTDAQEREKTYMLYNRTRKFIKYLDAALERIDNKTYGICKVTGKKISKGRLEAVPHTQISIEAKLKRR